jgi:HlyD family secretion protein
MKKIAFTLMITCLIFSCKNKNEADAFGNFETTETIVSSQGNGKINFLNIEEGQEIDAEKYVASIDTTLLYQQKMTLLSNQKTALGKKPNIKSQILVFKNQISTSESQLKTLEKERKRTINLLKDGAATSKQLDDLEAQIDVTKNQINVQKSQLNAQNSNLSLETNSMSNEATSIKEQIKQINIQIEQSKVLNPLKGTVTAKYVQANEIVNYGKPLYKIANLSKMILRSYFSGEQLGDIKINQAVTVRIDAKDNTYKEYKGVITWISSKSEFTPKIIQTKKDRVNFVYAVKIEVENDGSLKMGMPAEVVLIKK